MTRFDLPLLAVWIATAILLTCSATPHATRMPEGAINWVAQWIGSPPGDWRN